MTWRPRRLVAPPWWASLVLVAGALVLVAWLSLTQSPPGARELLPWLPGEDKTAHAVLYASLVVLWGYASSGATTRRTHRAIIVTVLAFVLGAVLELLQGQTSTRAADPWDAVANSVGIVVGAGWFLVEGDLVVGVGGRGRTR